MSTQHAAYQPNSECLPCRFVPVARVDCQLAGDPQLGPGDPRAGPARLAVAPGGAAVAVAPRRGNPMVSFAPHVLPMKRLALA